MKRFLLALAFLAAGTAQAATLSPLAPIDLSVAEGGRKLFTTEVKRDENIDNNGQRGADIILRSGHDTAGPSMNLDWGPSGTNYAWTLAYDGSAAAMTFHGATRTLDVLDGTWNAVWLWVQARDATRFATATTTLTITALNGATLATPLVAAVTDNAVDVTVRSRAPITSLSGTLNFGFTPKAGATGSRLGVSVKALEVAAVPLPAGLPLLAGALGALGLLRRRARRTG